MRAHSLRSPLLLLALSLGGCMSLRVDDAGQRHIVGLVWLTLPPAAVAPVGAESLRARSVGVALAQTPAGSGVVLGYSDQTLTVIRNDARIEISSDGGGAQ
jgi:hypothetical protein